MQPPTKRCALESTTIPGVRCLRLFFSSRRRHTRYIGDWSSDVCSSDLHGIELADLAAHRIEHSGLRPDLQGDVHVRLVFLSKREVHMRIFTSANDVLPYIRHDSDNLHLAWLSSLPPVHQDVFAEGIAIRPETAGRQAVDHHGGPRATFGREERSAAQQPDTDGPEVVLIDDVGLAVDQTSLVGGVAARGPYAVPEGSHAKGDGAGYGRRLH